MPTSSLNDPSALKVISLFSGIGGMDIGFAAEGVHAAAMLEWDRNCCVTLNANADFLGLLEPVVPHDITLTAPSDFFQGKVDLIVGGPPCQSFSAAGRRAGGVTGTGDTRGSLFWYYCRYVEHFQPKAFVFENVRGILSSNKGADWVLIRQSFAEIGYTLSWRILNAADYGVPQNRERVFLVGIRSDLDLEFKFPRPTHGPDSWSKTPIVTAGVALADLDDPDELVPPYGGKYGHLLADIPPGENYRFHTEEMGHPEPVFAWRSKFSGFLYKLSQDDVSKTIVAYQGRYDGPFHWKNRKCTLPELKRLQGFPDTFTIPQGYTEGVKQIGNSVAPPVAQALANALLQQLGVAVASPLPLVGSDVDFTFDKRKRDKAKKSRNARAAGPQVDLFSPTEDDSSLVTDSYHGSALIGGRAVNEVVSIVRGAAEIRLGDDNTCVDGLKIEIAFSGGVRSKIRSVRAVSKDVSLASYSVLWQTIHNLIERHTSFPSMMPLYGHFTEPYPKFKFSVDAPGQHPEACFIRLISAPGFTSTVHPLDTLNELRVNSTADFLKTARDYGLDIRTNNTNRTIRAGEFRVCYPFPNPSKEKQFIVWTEDGARKKNDFDLALLSAK